MKAIRVNTLDGQTGVMPLPEFSLEGDTLKLSVWVPQDISREEKEEIRKWLEECTEIFKKHFTK